MTGNKGIDCHPEAGKTLRIISVTIPIVPIKAVPSRKVELYAFVFDFEDPTALSPPAPLEIELIVEPVHDFRVFHTNRLIERKNNRNIFS